MRWPAVLFTLSFSLGLPALLASACGTPGLGEGTAGSGGATSSGTGTGANTGTTGTAGSSGTGGSISGLGGFGGQSEGGVVIGLCVPRTCTEIGASCGPQGDGCGDVIQCGNCQTPAICGGGGTPSVCGTSTSVCVKQTCADTGATCGPVSDGCGGLLQCGTCTAPTTCGGGGARSVCGGDDACIPTNCAAQGVTCGPAGDGCGGLLHCGDCTLPETCGGGGTPSACGVEQVASDAGSNCMPRTCAMLGFDCGPAGDGCGGTLQCGTCSSPKTCGGGGMPSVCGGTAGCVPQTCAMLGLTCGPAGDGCGGELACGACAAPTTCGGGGTPGVCGGSNDCVPKTCAELGFDCGPAGDGCGGLLQCGNTCPGGEICGGGGMPGVCGPVDAGTTTCTGLCLQQTPCPGTNVTTTISGTVYAPNGLDPIYDALVYIPNAPVQAFTPGVACEQCTSGVSGSPLVSTTSAPDGTFQLQNVPIGASIPLVIQLGRWRRQVTIPAVTACKNTAVAATLTNMPVCHTGNAAATCAGKAFGDIPLVAMVTGSADPLECVLRKIGIDDSEFTDPTANGGTGRIQFYLSNGENSPTLDAPSVTQLFASQTTLDAYDMVILSCDGSAGAANPPNPVPPGMGVNKPNNAAPATQALLLAYANAGGRVFATHYSYVWLFNDAPFSGTATWDQAQPDPNMGGNITGFVDFTNPKGQAFAQWSMVVGASTVYGQETLSQARHDFNAVTTSEAQQWLYWEDVNADAGTTTPTPLHYTFNTPVGASSANQCGRVLFSDFHVNNGAGNYLQGYPNECPALGTPLTAQEHLLEFMLFDLASCITPLVPPPPPICTSLTCFQQGFDCGPAGDGCGNLLDCGPCDAPETCGGGGMPGVCGGMPCTPVSCTTQGIQCGPAGNGCGDVLQCGNCPNGTTCGGGGQPGKCGKPICTPTTCAAQGIQCGPAGDGCGGLLVCGTCPPGESCGASQPGKCGAPDAGPCTALTCTSQGISCGPAGDGCGDQLDCGTCPPGQTCGGGGTPGVCGAPMCTPATCAALGIECGPAGDGCGGVIQCPACPANQTCGGGGLPGQCGSMCTPTTCETLGFNCGPAGDGCGGLVQCGTCTMPNTCGGGGVPGQCGHLSTN